MRQHVNLGLVALTAGVIAAASLFPVQSSGYGAAGFSLFDVAHLFAYFTLAAALLLVFHDTPRGHFEAVLVAVTFGIVIEVLQTGVPTRYLAGRDILINTLGASLILLDHRVPTVHRAIAAEDAALGRIRESL